MPKEKTSEGAEPDYLTLAAQNSGSVNSNLDDSKVAVSSVVGHLSTPEVNTPETDDLEDDVSEEDSSTELPDSNPDSGDSSEGDEEPADLDSALARIKELQRQVQEGQREVGKHGQEKGDLRRELAELRTRVELLDKGTSSQEPEEDLKTALLREVPALGALPAAQQEMLIALVDKTTEYRIREDSRVKELLQSVGTVQQSQAQARFAEQIQAAHETVGKDLLEKYQKQVGEFLESTQYRYSVNDALRFVAGEEYLTAKNAKKNSKEKESLSMQNGIARAGARKVPAQGSKKATPAPRSEREFFREEMKKALKEFGED